MVVKRLFGLFDLSGFSIFGIFFCPRQTGNFRLKVITVSCWHRAVGQIKRAIEFTLGEQTKVC